MRKYIIPVSFTIIIIVAIKLFFSWGVNPNFESDSLKIEFKGVIKEIKYSEKGFPTVKIDDVSIYLPAANTKTLKIHDSIVKQHGENVVNQYRNGKFIQSYLGAVAIEK